MKADLNSSRAVFGAASLIVVLVLMAAGCRANPDHQVVRSDSRPAATMSGGAHGGAVPAVPGMSMEAVEARWGPPDVLVGYGGGMIADYSIHGVSVEYDWEGRVVIAKPYRLSIESRPR